MQTSRTDRFGAREIKVAISAGMMAALAFAVSGCGTTLPEYIRNGFKVGPNYTAPPPAPLTKKWVDDENPRVNEGNPDLTAWWEVFDDPILNGLVERAYQRNLTVRAAGYQILAAEAARSIAAGQLFPQSQSLGASITQVQSSANQGTANLFGPSGTTTPTSPSAVTATGFGFGRFFTNNTTSLNASWELDFWGKFRRNLEAADASLDQSIANRDEVVVLLLANVATQYVQYRTLQERLRLARF
jgi:outer membrane protein TolC